MPSRRRFLSLTVASAATLSGCAALSSEPPPISEQPCPPADFVAPPASCSHSDAPEDGIAVRAVPETIASRRDAEEFSVELVNRSDAEMTLDASRWRVWRTRGGDWALVSDSDDSGRDDAVTIPPDGSVEWTGLRTAFGRFEGGLRSGLYVAAIPVSYGESAVNCVAVFRIDLG